MLVYIESVIALVLGLVASVTDFKNKKIFNKCLIVAIICSIVTYLLFYKSIDTYYFSKFIINFIITVIISFIFYVFKLWAAGDAKLFIAITFMIPVELYEVVKQNIFPSLNLLIIIFSVAFIYIVFETIYYFLIDKHKFRKIEETNKFNLKNEIIDYLLGYFLVLFSNNIILKYFEEFIFYNQSFLIVLNMLLLIFIYQVLNTEKVKKIILGIMILANIIYYLIFGFTLYAVNVKMLIIVITIMLFRKVSEKYNYEEILITDLTPRMILSYGSVLKFYTSNVKGLPKVTTENTDSRLTLSEVESIKRWSKTKNGDKTIVVVRHLPFAPFVFVGEFIFFLLKLY